MAMWQVGFLRPLFLHLCQESVCKTHTWQENRGEGRRLACLRAAQCAMELQSKLNRYEVSDCELFIKIALGYGQATSFHVGGVGGRWEFFVAGSPLVQVTVAEHQAKPGDVILSNAAYVSAAHPS